MSHKRLYSIIIGLTVLFAVIIGIIMVVHNKNEEPTEQPQALTISTKQIASDFSSPVGIGATTDSTDKRLFIIEQAGTIKTIIPGNDAASNNWFDIKDKVQSGGEMGLLGLAFHPDFAQNGYFFVNYIDKERNTVVSRYTAKDNTIDYASEKIILTIAQPHQNHNGGELAFGKDGYLYISTGDGGRAGDPDNRSQQKNNLFGKILRVDVNTDESYTVPESNPFVKEEGTLPEIWAYGLRNPWRMSFDKQTGDLYIADVGQGAIEEIDFQPATSKGGENYGWRCYEGTRDHNTEGCAGADDYVKPVVEYDHSDGKCSVTGGYVYRGEQYKNLQGKYIYGDFCGGQIFYAYEQNGAWTQYLSTKTNYSISAFGQGSDGELYFADYQSGAIYKIEVES